MGSFAFRPGLTHDLGNSRPAASSVRSNFSKVIGPAHAALRSALYLALLLAE